MKTRIGHFLLILTVMAGQSALCQVPFAIPILFSDDSVNTRTLAFGVLTSANPCVDTTDQHAGFQEFREPPMPPAGVFDARFDDPSGIPTACFDQGTLVDFRPLVAPGQIDTFLVRLQEGTGGFPFHLSWPGGLGVHADQMTMIDQFAGLAGINLDMLSTTNFDILPGMPLNFLIIIRPVVPASVGMRFTSLDPDSLFNADPLRPGKSRKAAKKFKGQTPNWSNLLSETVVQGGFAYGTSESDSAGGMVVGSSHMFLKNGIKWAPDKDSASKYCWVRLSSFNKTKNIGKNFADIQKSLYDKTGGHIGIARGFDSTGNPWDPKRKLLTKERKKFAPKLQSNRLFAELVALKFNIATSALGKTPAGFGDLLYNKPGHSLNGMSIMTISSFMDSTMTHWSIMGGNGGLSWDSLYDAVYEINRAFIGPLDTLYWQAGGDTSKLVLKGNVDIETVGFLSLPPGVFTPTRTTPVNSLSESPDEFEDDEFDEPAGVPETMKLYQNYPNPFNPSTKIAFRLRENSSVTLKVFDMLGREVSTLLTNEEMDEGLQTVEFTASGLASGVYFYRNEGTNVESEELMLPLTGKMILMK